MANWQLIEYTSNTLVRILQSHVTAILPAANVLVQTATTATFDELKATKRPIISLFLYRIVENPELRNAPRRRRPDGTERRQPMVLELCYLVTPWGARPSTSTTDDEKASREEHRLLGLTLQSFYDHAEIAHGELADDPDPDKPRIWNDLDSIQLMMESLSIEEMYRIWDASELGYRLSAAYRARVLALEAIAEPQAPRVLEADFRAGVAR